MTEWGEIVAGAENPFSVAIERYGRAPAGFVREVLGVEPDGWQLDALRALARGHTRLAIRSGHGVGKCLAVRTKVLTWDRGWVRAGSITLADRLVAVDGTPARIVGIYPQGERQMYRVITDDGGGAIVDGEHLWLTTTRSERKHGRSGRVRTTLEIADSLTFPNGVRDGLNHQLPQLLPIAYPAAELPMDPWLLGAWLGDGNSSGSATNIPAEKALLFAEAGASTPANSDYGFNARWRSQPALRGLELLGLRSWEKFIPEIYLRASIAQRTSLLQGLLDTDGTVGRLNCNLSITTTSERLVEGIADLVRGLGGVVRISLPRRKTYRYLGELRHGRPAWVISLALPSEIVPFRHPAKLARWNPSLHKNRTRTLGRHILRVERLRREEAVCFAVDHPDKLFVIKDHLVTHNTALAAWAMTWFANTRAPFKIAVTAPTAPQLFDALWPELVKWFNLLPKDWRRLWDITSDHITLKGDQECFITARTSRSDTPEAMAGLHSQHVLLVADEASGIDEAVYEAAGGSMSSPGAITLLIGNPTRSTGFFWRCHMMERDRWFTMRVSSAESPRVSKAFVEELEHRYGIDSNAYRVRVLGEFPVADADTLISAGLVDAAMLRDVPLDLTAPEIWGVDVARFGTDASVLVKRRGSVVTEMPRRWRNVDTMQLAGAVKAEFDASINAKPALIVVDVIGIGAGVVDRLHEQSLPVLGLNVSESPSVTGRYGRLRDELWVRCREWLETRSVRLPRDDQLRDDLVSPRYSFLSDGRLQVESKSLMRSRGRPSPDAADALNLTFAEQGLGVGSGMTSGLHGGAAMRMDLGAAMEV